MQFDAMPCEVQEYITHLLSVDSSELFRLQLTDVQFMSFEHPIYLILHLCYRDRRPFLKIINNRFYYFLDIKVGPNITGGPDLFLIPTNFIVGTVLAHCQLGVVVLQLLYIFEASADLCLEAISVRQIFCTSQPECTTTLCLLPV